MTLTSNHIRIFKTCNLYACYIIVAICLVIPGPTLVDLTYSLNIDIKDIAYIYPARAGGSLLGALVGGIIFDMTKKKQILFMIATFTLSITTFGIPWSKNVAILIIWMILNGVSIGTLVTSGSVFCLQLWGEKSRPFYQALYFSNSVGSFIGPLIATPFLSNYENETKGLNKSISKNQSDLQISTEDTFSDTDLNTYNSISTITFAYVTVSTLGLIVTIFYVIMCIVEPIDKANSSCGTPNPVTEKLKFKIILVFLAFFITFTTNGIEIGYNQMLTVYALKSPLHLPTVIGSYMTSAYFFSVAISRLVAIFVTIKWGNLVLICMDLSIMFVASLILLFIAEYYEWSLWFSSILLGFGMGSLAPACINWLNRHMPITNKISSVFTIGYSLSAMVFPYIIGYYIKEKPSVFIYASVANCVSLFIVNICMYFILKPTPDKNTFQEK